MNSPSTDAAFTPELHQQLLRMHCEQPLTAVAAAEQCGISLLQFTAWLQQQRTRDDLAALRFSADFSMHMFLGQQRLSAIVKLLEISNEAEGETARRASKDLLAFNFMPPPKPAPEPPREQPPATGPKAEIVRYFEELQLATLPRFERRPASPPRPPAPGGDSKSTRFTKSTGIALLILAACFSLPSEPARSHGPAMRLGLDVHALNFGLQADTLSDSTPPPLHPFPTSSRMDTASVSRRTTRPANRTPDSADAGPLAPADTFVRRHIGPSDEEVADMLRTLGLDSLDELADAVVPAAIRSNKPLNLAGLDALLGEHDALARLRGIAEQNQVFRSYLGMGYHGTITPPVIQRNILENPGWYTQYTPYQAEISQGRLEALLNFQTMVADLTALSLAGSSLLDEATAAAEAMAMCRGIKEDRNAFFVADHCHPQTIAVVRTRAASMGIELRVGPLDQLKLSDDVCGVLVQYPATDGAIHDFDDLTQRVHDAGSLLVVAADILALALIKPPGEFASGGADIAVGSTQRFGVPMGFGGPHAGYLATRHEFARKMPGRLVGISKDAQGDHAYRLAIQTREQHIRRDRATSNICTAQVLLAIIAGMYAVYHGPEGIRRIARRVHAAAAILAAALRDAGHEVMHERFFDTLRVKPRGKAADVLAAAAKQRLNLRDFGDGTLGITVDEPITREEVATLLNLFNAAPQSAIRNPQSAIENRCSGFLTHPVFNAYHSETELLRYIKKLESRDLSLTHSMIPLGSCTMKLNATVEMFPVTWPQFANMHPFAPPEQTRGYQKLFSDLESWLAEITGFAAVSLQPNAGSQGEYAGLLTIRAYHESRGEGHRDICLIPTSAHGTNPATAVIAGYKVLAVACDQHGNIDLNDLNAKATQHAGKLAALMITYPSTHGVFEPNVKECIEAVHAHGGQVYMDGANMNAQVGLTSPGEIGADVCHLNLHKTFCIPHGGGGPGMGPIAVAEHLAPFLPAHPFAPQASSLKPQDSSPPSAGPVSAAPYGSPMILPIPWVYIALMGAPGLKRATQVAILNANYIAKRLEGHYEVVYRGLDHRPSHSPTSNLQPPASPPQASSLKPQASLSPVAHECIIDCRCFTKSAGVSVEDIAKRLMDYGFHAPTMSFPVAGTLMIEPTESESKAELDRFCDALIAIRREIKLIEDGTMDRADNPLHGAPHTAAAVTDDNWPHKYSRRVAAWPAPWVTGHKFWPAVGRIDNPYGDRNLICTCDPDWQS